ncbi:MAG TPA: hypothetical protein VHE12_08335 [bacterium]|nr:hypothetical protein [bacterium]
MNLQKIGVKFFLGSGTEIPLSSFIPVFHHWIQDDLLEGLLVDVAEYTHVHQGPGVLVVAHEANYSLDEELGKRGFLYTQKRPPEKSSQEHLATAFRRVLKGCQLLEKDTAVGGVKFDTTRFQVFVNDRAEAPFNSESLGALESELNPFLSSLLAGEKFQLIPEKDPQRRVGFEVKVPKPESLETLAGRLPA